MTPVLVRSLKRTLVVTATLGIAVVMAQPPASAGPAAQPDGTASTTVVYHHDDALANASVRTITGSRTPDGGCTFRLPSLDLGPGGSAVEARQVATDYTTCTTTVEIGTPTTDTTTPTTGTSESQLAAPIGAATRGRTQVSPLATSSSGYYRVWWEDVINLKVHEVKTNISWTWDGGCVTASNGSADYWWLSGTGWSKYSSSSYIARSCNNARVYTDTTYQNGAFCWPGTVWSYYDDVTAKGQYDGWLYGWVNSTWTTYPFACPNLHYHTELVRVTG